jgi:hypothetical protein
MVPVLATNKFCCGTPTSGANRKAQMKNINGMVLRLRSAHNAIRLVQAVCKDNKKQ